MLVALTICFIKVSSVSYATLDHFANVFIVLLNVCHAKNVAVVPHTALKGSDCVAIGVTVGTTTGAANDFNIVDPNLNGFHKTGATDVHASISKFSTSSIISSTVHVIISFCHVIVSFSHVVGVVSSDDDELHHDGISLHCATNSAPDNGIVVGKLGFHPLNTYHHLVGLLGAVRFDSYFHVIGETSLHHLLSNVISYTFLSYCTLTTVLPSHLMTFCMISFAVNHVYSFATACVISSVVHSSVSLSISSYELSLAFSNACTTVYSIHDFGSQTAVYFLYP
jgi:hypothetical protein